MKFISVSGMRFSNTPHGGRLADVHIIRGLNPMGMSFKRIAACFIIWSFLLSFLLPVPCYAEIMDRVVAFVDDQAITLSEFRKQYEASVELSPGITEDEVLNAMINRKLLLMEARKYRIEAPSEEEILNDYIDLKLRAFIRVGETEIEAFYSRNINQFRGRDYEDVRDEIESYLTEKELNEKLKETINELKLDAYIKIQLSTEGKEKIDGDNYD